MFCFVRNEQLIGHWKSCVLFIFGHFISNLQRCWLNMFGGKSNTSLRPLYVCLCWHEHAWHLEDSYWTDSQSVLLGLLIILMSTVISWPSLHHVTLSCWL